jgi:hypothetical protein
VATKVKIMTPLWSLNWKRSLCFKKKRCSTPRAGGITHLRMQEFLA